MSDSAARAALVGRRDAGKRAFDVTFSALGLALLAPIWMCAAIAIKLDGGPVYFRQERIGLGGRPFRMWKFRTMIPDAERRGPLITVGRDPRITRVGAFLRRSKLDEIPQLLNVLHGEMSLVGPRPEVPRYVAQYTAEQRAVLQLMPGITDPASVAYRDESRLLGRVSDPERYYVEVVMPDKIRLNLAHAAHATRVRDVLVILQTLGVWPRSRNATRNRESPVS